jgi:hypothetical protein
LFAKIATDGVYVTEGRLLDVVDEAWARDRLDVDGARAAKPWCEPAGRG